MLSLPPSVRVFMARGATDMRKSFDTLAAVVCDVVDEDPQSGHLFVFVNRRKNRMKMLWWDRSGYCLLAKRLEHGQFCVYDQAAGKAGAYQMKSSELMLLLEGIDLRGARRRLPHDERVRETAARTA
jgi:transposase